MNDFGMNLTTNNLTHIMVERRPVIVTGGGDLTWEEMITVSGPHGKVEISLPAYGTQNAHMTTQVFQAMSEVTMATVETSLGRYFEEDYPNTHNTEVIR